MVQNFCADGEFFKSKVHTDKQKISREALNGILSHIFQIKNQQQIEFKNQTRNFNELNSIEKLYTKFLFHHYFVHPLQRMISNWRRLHLTLHTLNWLLTICTKIILKFLKFSSAPDGTKLFSKIMGYGGGTGLLKQISSKL